MKDGSSRNVLVANESVPSMKRTGMLRVDMWGGRGMLFRRSIGPSQRRDSGFTLLELMIAVAIIGILATLLTPVVQTAREKARSTSCVSNLRAIGTALTMFADDSNGHMPPTLDVLANGIYLPQNSGALLEPKANLSYAYRQPPTLWQSNGASVSVEDPTDLHLGGRNQLMNDGSIRKLNQ